MTWSLNWGGAKAWTSGDNVKSLEGRSGPRCGAGLSAG